MARNAVLVLSLNGGSWDGLAPWLEQGDMPTLRRLVESGSSGELQAILPTYVAPNWASFWTGENAGRHSVFSQAALGKTAVLSRRVNSRFLKRPTWLELASRQGFRVVSLYAPLTYPAQSLNGFVVSERELEGFAYPPDLVQELRDHFSPPLIPKYNQMAPAGGFSTPTDVQEFVQGQIRSIARTKNIAQHLLNKSPWDVSVIHFFATDYLYHALWHGVHPNHSAFDPLVQQELRNFFRALDSAMGDLIGASHPSSVMVFSDHGFMTCRKILNLSRALRDLGMLRPLTFSERLMRKMTRRIWETRTLNEVLARVRSRFRPVWQRWILTADKQANVYLDDKALYVMTLKDSARRITTLLSKLLEGLEDPDTGERIIRKAWRAEELYGEIELRGWDILVLEFSDGYTGRNGNLDAPLLWPVQPGRDYLVGTHTQTGFWVFSGKNIRSMQGCRAGILDLPPTLLSYLGLSIPNSMQGNVLPIFHACGGG